MVDENIARASLMHKKIMESEYSFRVLTLDGMDGDKDGIPRKDSEDTPSILFNGHRFGELPSSYVVGDCATYQQNPSDIRVKFDESLDLDATYPESEYFMDNKLKKWVRKIT